MQIGHGSAWCFFLLWHQRGTDCQLAVVFDPLIDNQRTFEKHRFYLPFLALVTSGCQKKATK
jgi:hypothetical protein